MLSTHESEVTSWRVRGKQVRQRPSEEVAKDAGDICDYSVRLNWDGRRTKRSAPDKKEFESPIVSVKRFQWHHHDFRTKNGQIVEVAIEDNQGLEVSSPFGHQPKQYRSPGRVSMTDPEHNLPAIYSNHGTHHTSDTLTFIDESHQLHWGSTDRESYGGKRRLDASKDIDLSRPLHKGFELDATEPTCHRRSDESFAEKLDIRLHQIAIPPAEHSAMASSTTLFSCLSPIDEPLTRAISSRGNHTARDSSLESSRPFDSAESWLVENRETRELARQSGCLWEALDMYRFQGPLNNLNVYPYEVGTLYAFDEGKIDEDLRQSAGENGNLLSYGTYRSNQNIVYFGE
ncbi:hypothetical protein E4U55_000642 [Claviceps digitariae]|nr:hypothetical protein E4U55_000642 [Claviceps digitariae]